MGSAQRRAREKENLRRAILDAARELFVTENYEAVSMRRIASKIEYSPTAIYLYFKDKDEIFLNLIGEGFAILSDQLEAIEEADPLLRLQKGGQVYLNFAFTQTHYYRLMFEIGNKQQSDLGICSQAEEMGRRAFGFIRKCVSEAQAQGMFRADTDEEIASHTVWAAMHGAVSLALSGRLSMLTEEQHPAFFQAVFEMVTRGHRA